jgi:tripartite-type tricarboxylate transporter receptor subunit TctC
MTTRPTCIYVLTSFTCVFFLGMASVSAADDFYKGKQITIVSSANSGTTYDLYSRTLAKYLTKYIPGNPTFIVQNMQGAGGLKAANYIANNAPKDGTVIAGTHPVIPIAPLTTPADAQYDANKLSWIGSATRELYVGYVWNTAPVKTYAETLEKEVLVGSTGPGSFSADMPILSNELLGTKFKLISGYPGSPQTQLAIQRGEVQGVMGTAWVSLKRTEPTWISENKIRILVQYGFKRNPQLSADVPAFIDFAKTEADRQAIKFMVARLDHGKPYFGPPGMPADRLDILRRAFDKVVKDPDFIADLSKQDGEVDGPMTGEELAAVVAEEAATPPAVVKRIEEAISKYVGR